MKFSIGRHVVVNENDGSYLVTYKADAIDEQTAIKGIVEALRSVADSIEKHGFPYKEVLA